VRRLARRIAWGLVIAIGLLIGVLAVATFVTARAGNPRLWPPSAGAPPVEIHVVSHGWHSGVVLSRAAMADYASRQGRPVLASVAQRLANFRWLEIGWGDEGFYRSAPDLAALDVTLAARALLRPGNPSVLHVVGLSDHPRTSFPQADIVRIELSSEGFSRLLDRLDASFARGSGGAAPQPLGPGLYGTSLFYRGVETFNLLNVCNHWVARLLSIAGLPTAPVVATLPQGLLLDLQWRSKLPLLPRT
jgi:uncharacterized protein (TIGR02117 family)